MNIILIILVVLFAFVVFNGFGKSGGKKPQEPKQCEELIDQLGEFLGRGSLNAPGAVMPEWLGNFYRMNQSGDELYFKCLLPRFLDDVRDQGINLMNWSDKNQPDPLKNSLPGIIEKFRGPFVYKGNVIFLRCRAKEFGGLPKDMEQREWFIREKAIFFEYDAYIVSERDFFGIIKGVLQTQLNRTI
jgi:hypothetical protein